MTGSHSDLDHQVARRIVAHIGSSSLLSTDALLKLGSREDINAVLEDFRARGWIDLTAPIRRETNYIVNRIYNRRALEDLAAAEGGI